ncbi:uncharacterized protein [Prorops nasuta]|uniref:uncharacterized protein n=1 Tax=Prorops nasuta TaxID=863751 RepID=UPI0034CD1671
MNLALIVLAFVAGLAAAQYSDGDASTGQKGNLPGPLRAVRYQKFPKNSALQSVLGNRARRLPAITYRSKTISDEGSSQPLVFSLPRPIRPPIPQSGAIFSQQVKPVTERSEEFEEETSVEKEEDRHDHRQEHGSNSSPETEEKEEDVVEETLPQLRHGPSTQFGGPVTRPPISFGPGPLQTLQGHAQQQPLQYHRAYAGSSLPQPIQRGSVPPPTKPVKTRKQFIDDTSKQSIKPPAKSYKAYDTRGKKPVAQSIKRYREENPDGSIAWGFENDDGSYKEEVIGIDCITRGKYGYVDPDGVRREYTYETGIKCDEEDRQLDEENGFVDYQENKLVLPNGRSIDLSSMGKKQSRRPRL